MVPIGVAPEGIGDTTALVLDVVVAVTVAALFSRRIVRWMWYPRQAALRRYEYFRKVGVVGYFDEAARSLAFLSGCGFYAAVRAELRWLWVAFATLDLLLAVFMAAASWYSRRHPTIVPERTFHPATPDQLERLVAAGSRQQWLPIALLLLWLYSWRSLIGA